MFIIKPKEGISIHTKQKILLEALRLFSQKGYDAVSVEQIADAVGIRVPSLYKHYKGKQDIFEAILRKRRSGTGNSRIPFPFIWGILSRTCRCSAPSPQMRWWRRCAP